MTTTISGGLKCPKCSAELKEFSSHELRLSRCFKCNGVWFDKDELKKVIDERDKNLSWMHFDLWSKKEKIGAAHGKRSCPNCAKAMAKLRYDNSEVEVDFCSRCGGVWLDNGELTRIIDFLEKALIKKDVPGYLAEMIKEGEKAVLDPKNRTEELGHFLILAKLLQYRILAEHTFIEKIISVLPT